MLALTKVLGGDVLVRLHQTRVTGLGPRQREKVICSEKPSRGTGCPLSAEEYAALPQKLAVRKTPGRWEILLEMAAADLLPVGPNRPEPRAIKRRPKNDQRLTAPRSSFQEVPYRHRTKKRLN